MNYSPTEVKVREATNGEEAWGPHGTVMGEIAVETYATSRWLVSHRHRRHARRRCALMPVPVRAA